MELKVDAPGILKQLPGAVVADARSNLWARKGAYKTGGKSELAFPFFMCCL